MSKLAHLQDNHIIIPKDGKKSHSNESISTGSEDLYQSHLQEEVRKLHYDIKSKDILLDKINGVFTNQESSNQ